MSAMTPANVFRIRHIPYRQVLSYDGKTEIPGHMKVGDCIYQTIAGSVRRLSAGQESFLFPHELQIGGQGYLFLTLKFNPALARFLG